MDLILWRHAEAEDAAPGLADIRRRLTPRGEKQARLISRWLSRHLPKGTRILVSPAMRAQQTVLPLDRPYVTVDSIGPEASVDALLSASTWPNAPEAVLIVGHQPTLGGLAARLVCDSESGFSIRKGAVWWISRRNKPGDDKTFLRAVLTPDMA